MIRPSLAFSSLALAGTLACTSEGAAAAVGVPAPAAAPAAASAPKAGPATERAVFAGGCFWGIEAVFEHVQGVSSSRSGYAGGAAATADYGTVSEGESGHAESVEVVFDPAQVSYGQLLQVFFSVAHDPTQLNRQGPDTGTQYRSALFTTSPEQERTARAYIEQLTVARTFPAPIVTKVSPLAEFFPAEGYHQDYLKNHPNQPYIVANDLPKLKALQQAFPKLYR